MEAGVINFVGASACGGLLLVWAKSFEKTKDEEEEIKPYLIVETVYELLEKIKLAITDVFHRLIKLRTIEEWNGYETEEDLPIQEPGDFEVFV